MDRSKIKEILIEKLVELFADKNIDKDVLEYVDLIDDVGMDSILFISFVIEIEALFEISIPDDVLLMENFRNVKKIIDLVLIEYEIKFGKEKRDDKAWNDVEVCFGT